MKYIDIHCHLDFGNYDSDREEVLGRMKENGVGAITIGTDLESSKRAIEIAEDYENIWACIGVHPADNHSEIWNEEEFEKLSKSKKVVAVGECGLDYFRVHDLGQKSKQKELFESQIEFALKYDKPLMLHCRNAYDDVLDILINYKKEFGQKLRGNCHFFAGSVEQAKKFIDMDFSLSFTGVITFTSDYDEVIRFLPKESIMPETDAPFVSPVPYRGKRNEPIFVAEIVKKMAVIRGENEDLLRKQLLTNAQKLFGVGLPN